MPLPFQHKPEAMKLDKERLEKLIIETIKTCHDPEIPVDIWELGLIYGIDIDDEANVKVTMTLTSPNCPVAESLPMEVQDKINGMAEVNDAKVEITFEPPWTKDLMSEEAQFELGFL